MIQKQFWNKNTLEVKPDFTQTKNTSDEDIYKTIWSREEMSAEADSLWNRDCQTYSAKSQIVNILGLWAMLSLSLLLNFAIGERKQT